MIDVQEVLKRKEDEIARVRREIDALHLVAPLLSDSADGHSFESSDETEMVLPPLEHQSTDESLHESHRFNELSPERDETMFESIPPKRSLLRDWFGKAAGE